MKRELPPTDGLPLRAGDLFGADADLAATLARLLAIPRPLLTCSGTAALVVALRVLKQRSPSRSRAIVGGWSCPLVPLAAALCPGVEFVLCDLAENSLDLCPTMLARLCDEAPPLAIIVTHLAGRVSDTAPALACARRCGAAVIEDAAQALGARVGDESVGLRGDIGFFSLAFGKGLTSGEGGVLFSRDPDLRADLQREALVALPVRRGWELRRSAALLGYAALYNPVGLRAAYGLPLRRALRRGDVIAAVGDDFTADDIPLHALGHWRAGVAARAAARLPDYWSRGQRRAERRIAALRALPGVEVFADRPGERGVWPFLLIRLPTGAARDAVLAALWDRGAGVTRLFARALADYPALADRFTDASPQAQARSLAARTLTLTNSSWLTDGDFAAIVACISLQLRRLSTPR
ncbi:DegT/DnrJ/EryC1/StrS family aminotransferase [Pluralibacter gergoviae]|uniref:DegT/DnrJ/EryC1/StrS family aminotransferase n=1 Tax=Pluralibacter gergoviae TaxID=61647 RepID=A0AAI9GKG8_PLUGE|nr:DegT/DnrJ/EryC1/StrS family aminotransferase [Pluralibacter gergoviae]EKV9910198.1 DegT/DnrJ/EryC1/StrS family aminotransferase [Pluralibacter gergoviae]EKW7276703.1 DegT/DnrJ/EryC1/StrS family aminotransferase [Pluralibacter gergoviae]ELD4293386.1 DegT/DnrJ/EryC1/StrS family aminotransferase [Pluralibacter gergoviae]ELD4304164.1 DegT/DnrJ/EryC1/StrS family aminotransferase [Pluralibacter gergoviae]